MESGEDDEFSNDILNMDLDMDPDQVNHVILGSDLEWDSNDFDSDVPGRKRLRGVADPEEEEVFLDGFTKVTRHKKKINQRGSPLRDTAQGNSSLPPLPDDDLDNFVEIAVSSKEALPKKIGMARILRSGNVTGVLKVTYKSPYKLLLRFKDNDSAGTLMNCTQIIDAGWICRKTSEVAFTYGLVKDVDLDIDDDKIINEFQSDWKIISAKRLNKRDRDSKWIRSEKVRLQFPGSGLPPYVLSYGLRLEVEPYIFPVTQCSKCWKFGHIRNFCPSNRQRCPKCGADHDNCETTKFKCINCKGDHMSIVKSLCPAFYREKKIREVMAEENCTYKVALIKIRQAVEPKSIIYAEEFKEPLENVVSHSQGKSFADVVKANKILKKSATVNQHEMWKTLKRNNDQYNKRRQNKETEGSFSQKNKTDPWHNSRERINNGEEPRKQRDEEILKRFLNKLKEIILGKEDWGEKVHMVVKYIIEEVKLLLKEFMNVDALLNLLNVTWNSCTTS